MQLDTGAVEIVRDLAKQKMSQRHIAETLYKKGYRSGRGGRIDQSSVSQFMRKNGVPTNSKFAKNRVRRSFHTAKTANTTALSAGFITDLINRTDLNKDQKTKIITALF